MCLLFSSDSAHQRANGNLKYFEYQLAKQKKVEAEEGLKEKEEREREKREVSEKKGRPADYLPERRKYEQLCRGEGIKMVRCCIDHWWHFKSEDRLLVVAGIE